MKFNPKTIAREWSHKISSGIPDLKNKWHLDKLEELLNEKGYSRYFTNELLDNITTSRLVLDEAKFLKNIVSKMKRVWTSIKGKIKSLFSSKLKNLMPGEETVIKIPGLKTEHKIEYMNLKDLLNEGALQSIKGNYNEALTCQYIYNQDGKKGVGITPKYSSYKSEVNNIVPPAPADVEVPLYVKCNLPCSDQTTWSEAIASSAPT